MIWQSVASGLATVASGHPPSRRSVMLVPLLCTWVGVLWRMRRTGVMPHRAGAGRSGGGRTVVRATPGRWNQRKDLCAAAQPFGAGHPCLHMTALLSGVPASEGLGGTQMVLRDCITGITGRTRLRGGPRNFLIAWPGSAWDNPEIRAGGYESAVMSALFCQARGEPGR